MPLFLLIVSLLMTNMEGSENAFSVGTNKIIRDRRVSVQWDSIVLQYAMTRLTES